MAASYFRFFSTSGRVQEEARPTMFAKTCTCTPVHTKLIPTYETKETEVVPRVTMTSSDEDMQNITKMTSQIKNFFGF